MPKRLRPKAKRPRKSDVNVAAFSAVQAITGAEPVNGEELLADPELRRQLREAKEADAARRGKK